MAAMGLLAMLQPLALIAATIVSDFNDGVPDWDSISLRGMSFSEASGQLVATGNIPSGNDCITVNLS